MHRGWWIAAAAVAVALGLGFGLWKTTPLSSDLSPEQIYAASFTDLEGQTQPLSQWRGKILILNFWATWCPPCREEIPDFIAVDKAFRAQGVAIIGIALDERELVAEFGKEIGISYPMLLGGAAGYEFAAQLGNSGDGIPFTAIINRQGEVVYLGSGVMRRAELEKQIAKLL